MLRHRASSIVIWKSCVLAFHAKDPATGASYVFPPGGQIEPSESPVQAAVRETKEETGYWIRIDPKFTRREFYEFNWNSQVNFCDTWFFRGMMDPLDQIPSPVQDASYHLGVNWVPIRNVPQVFNYHPVILQAVQAVSGEFIAEEHSIEFFRNRFLDFENVARLYSGAGLNAESKRLAQMFANSNLTVSAWHGDELVGVARVLTDFTTICFILDLPIDQSRAGLGASLVSCVQKVIGPEIKIQFTRGISK